MDSRRRFRFVGIVISGFATSICAPPSPAQVPPRATQPTQAGRGTGGERAPAYPARPPAPPEQVTHGEQLLSADKRRVLTEAFRVLKPGGRFAVSDVIVRGEVPAAVRRSMELWVGCVAGALEEHAYRDLLAAAGFLEIGIEPTRIYEFADARAVLAGAVLDAEVLAREVGGRIMGAFVRARKPAAPA